MTLRYAAALAASLTFAAPALADSFLECDSGGYRYTYCPADTRFGVELSRQKSSTPCTFNSTWGYDSGGVWTDGGCRGTFRILEGRSAPQSYDDDSGNADAILDAVINDGTLAALQDEDEYQGREPGYGAVDAVIACALAAEARETERGAIAIYFDGINRVTPRGRRSFTVDAAMTVEFRNGRQRSYGAECRIQSGRVTSYSRR